MVHLLAHHGPEALVPFLLGAGTLTWHWARLRLSTRRGSGRGGGGDDVEEVVAVALELGRPDARAPRQLAQ